MSTGFQARKAKGSKGECRATKCRHTVTLERTLFETIREAAMANSRSISEEMAAQLAAIFSTTEKLPATPQRQAV